jgi:hypothetical protein
MRLTHIIAHAPGCVLTRAPVPRATGEDRERPGHHSRRDADSREGAEGNGTLLWHLPQVLEKVSLSLFGKCVFL